tara:strand:- start:2490 stop:2993 length:504 start_codon:yes stop_codon:yes gene_type:complete
MKRTLVLAGFCTAALMLESAASSQAKVLVLPVPDSARELCGNGCLNPIEAISYADHVGTKAGVSGKFLMVVQAVGETKDTIFLNSEEDYRDRNCLTIAVRKSVMDQILKSGGYASAEEAFRGKQIVVTGTARKLRVDFIGNDQKPTGKYYYQIHVRVRDAKQIDIVS